MIQDGCSVDGLAIRFLTGYDRSRASLGILVLVLGGRSAAFLNSLHGYWYVVNARTLSHKSMQVLKSTKIF
jgi:hypothetical protein